MSSYDEFFNEDGTRRVDPLTKVGIMLALRHLAIRQGAREPLAALEWALSRGYLAPRREVVLERGKDDLVLTPAGQEVVAAYWFDVDRRRLHKGRGLLLGGA